MSGQFREGQGCIVMQANSKEKVKTRKETVKTREEIVKRR